MFVSLGVHTTRPPDHPTGWWQHPITLLWLGGKNTHELTILFLNKAAIRRISICSISTRPGHTLVLRAQSGNPPAWWPHDYITAPHTWCAPLGSIRWRPPTHNVHSWVWSRRSSAWKGWSAHSCLWRSYRSKWRSLSISGSWSLMRGETEWRIGAGAAASSGKWPKERHLGYKWLQRAFSEGWLASPSETGGQIGVAWEAELALDGCFVSPPVLV